jgi:predicted nuclease of predicted toxin-antitoxin system
MACRFWLPTTLMRFVNQSRKQCRNSVGKTDREVREFAIQTERALVTLDADFANLVRFSDYKVPESLQIVDEIPRNATGKVDRQSLSKMRTDCSNLSLKKYRRINRRRRPILVPYKFVGLVSSPRWILRPTAEEAIRSTITAIGTTDGRSPKNYSRLELRQRDKSSEPILSYKQHSSKLLKLEKHNEFRD